MDQSAQSVGSPVRGNRLIRWLIGCVLLGAAIWICSVYAGTWKDRFFARKFRVIDPGKMYASGQVNERLIRQLLQDYHIKRIISLEKDDPTDPDVAAEIAAARELNIERMNDPLSGDGTGDIHSYADAVAQMVEAERLGEPTLMHCSSGAQRSNGATFYYRVFIQDWSARDAAAEMVRNGHDPAGNPKLIPYLNENMGAMAELLVGKGVIAKAPEPLPVIDLN